MFANRNALRTIVLLVAGMMVLSVNGIATAQGNPTNVVTGFLDAWATNDFPAMYGYLSSVSKSDVPPQQFENTYAAVDETLNMTGLTYTITNTHVQGDTAAITYDITIQSAAFGDINDSGRVMRLFNDGIAWGVVWSRMDIFEGLAGTAQLTASGRLPERATIYDRNGQPIASPGTRVALYTRLIDIPNQEDCVTLLVEITRRRPDEFRTQFVGWAQDTFFFLVELNIDTYNRYADALSNICGTLVPNPDRDFRQTRVYYGDNALTHVTGYVGPIQPEQLSDFQRLGYTEGDPVGQYSIENAYQDILAGRPERILRISLGSVTLREFSSAAGQAPTPLQLTIDRNVQLATAQAIADAYHYAIGNWGSPDISAGGAVVVLDVNSGAILAMVSYPLVDPKLFDNSSPDPGRGDLLTRTFNDGRRPLSNHALSEQESPGSTFKVVTAAAALNEGLIQPQQTFFCDLEWDGRELGDTLNFRTDWRVTAELDPAGDITPAQALMSSCNPFFWEYGARLHRDVAPNALADYAVRMGLTQPFDLGIAVREAQGIVSTSPTRDTAISESVGQGSVVVPPIQMAAMTAGIANGGTVWEPYLIQQVGGFDGTDVVEDIQPNIWSEFSFNPGVVQTLQQGMCGVVSNFDLGTAYDVFENAPYTSCGKTGTAQTGLYPNAWYISYAPAENPQIAVVVMVTQSRDGSAIAAPIARRIYDYYFNAPVEPYPEWWFEEEYVPPELPPNSTGG